MKRLSKYLALSAVLVAAFSNAAQAQLLYGTASVRNAAIRNYPIGANETGRYARFIMDNRLSDMQFENRDFENWYPLDVRSKCKMTHFMRGRLQTTDSPVIDQEIGRYIRVLEDDRLYANNIIMSNRDFEAYQQPSPYMPKARRAMARHYLRGLAVDTNLKPLFPCGTGVCASPGWWY